MIAMKAWYWLIAGMLLVLLELAIPSFTIFWFGLGAIITAGFLWFFPAIPLSVQVFVWAVASVGFTILWFRCFKPIMTDKTKAGISLEAVKGEIGQVIQAPIGGKRGIVRFTTPLLGAEEWRFICKGEIEVGDRASVVEVSGNTLIIEKKQPALAGNKGRNQP